MYYSKLLNEIVKCYLIRNRKKYITIKKYKTQQLTLTNQIILQSRTMLRNGMEQNFFYLFIKTKDLYTREKYPFKHKSQFKNHLCFPKKKTFFIWVFIHILFFNNTLTVTGLEFVFEQFQMYSCRRLCVGIKSNLQMEEGCASGLYTTLVLQWGSKYIFGPDFLFYN